METNPVDSKASKPRLPHRWLFRWGIGFWIVVWIASVFSYRGFYLNVKGYSGVLNIGQGSVKCSVRPFTMGAGGTKFGVVTYGNGFDPSLSLKKIQQEPENITAMLARGGWKNRDFGSSTSVSFPFAGFLWFWLAAGWWSEIRLRRLAEAKVDGNPIGVPFSRRRLIELTVALVALGLAIPFFAIRGRQADNVYACYVGVRNIQQAIRGYEGVKGLYAGAPLKWDDVFGMRGFFPSEHFPECPSGGDYQLTPVVPGIGEIAAKCSHPDHRQYFLRQDTSEW